MGRTLARRAAFVALARALLRARGAAPLAVRLAAIPRMVVATVRGRYDGRARLGLMALAAGYIVSPVDLIPEALLGLVGLADDAVVLAWLAGAILAETERFLEWERGYRRVTVGSTP